MSADVAQVVGVKGVDAGAAAEAAAGTAAESGSNLPAQVRIVSAVSFVLVVVATPRTAWWAFFGYALLVTGVGVALRVPARAVFGKFVWEIPFVAFAFLLPFVALGPKVAVGPLWLTEAGLWAAWNILAKATLGMAVAAVLAATTPPAAIVAGLSRLHLPGLMVQIVAFMIRYLEVVRGEAERMRVARAARGFRSRHVRAWPALGGSLGALFIRTYERGERVHTAMLARGYDGSATPWSGDARAASWRQWLLGLVPTLLAASVWLASVAAASLWQAW